MKKFVHFKRQTDLLKKEKEPKPIALRDISRSDLDDILKLDECIKINRNSVFVGRNFICDVRILFNDKNHELNIKNMLSPLNNSIQNIKRLIEYWSNGLEKYKEILKELDE